MLVCSHIKNYSRKPFLSPNYEDNEIITLPYTLSIFSNAYIFIIWL